MATDTEDANYVKAFEQVALEWIASLDPEERDKLIASIPAKDEALTPAEPSLKCFMVSTIVKAAVVAENPAQAEHFARHEYLHEEFGLTGPGEVDVVEVDGDYLKEHPQWYGSTPWNCLEDDGDEKGVEDYI